MTTSPLPSSLAHPRPSAPAQALSLGRHLLVRFVISDDATMLEVARGVVQNNILVESLPSMSIPVDEIEFLWSRATEGVDCDSSSIVLSFNALFIQPEHIGAPAETPRLRMSEVRAMFSPYVALGLRMPPKDEPTKPHGFVKPLLSGADIETRWFLEAVRGRRVVGRANRRPAERLTIWADASVIPGKAGETPSWCAAAVTSEGEWAVLHGEKHIDASSAEVVAIGIAMVLAHRRRAEKVRIRSDSRFAVGRMLAAKRKAAERDDVPVRYGNTPQEARYALGTALHMMRTYPDRDVDFAWIKGHRENAGNTAVDRISRLYTRRAKAGIEESSTNRYDDDVRHIVIDSGLFDENGDLVPNLRYPHFSDPE